MDALCPLNLAASAVGGGTADVLAEWAAAEGVDLASPEKPAGPSGAAGSSLASAPKPQAADRTGPVGTREDFLTAFHRQQLWKDILVEGLTLTAAFVVFYRVSRGAVLLESCALRKMPGL